MRCIASGQAQAQQMDDNMALKAFRKWFSSADERAQAGPLYAAIIAEARLPHWYVEGGVADSIDGRFDMVNAVLALVLIRMEALGEDAQMPSTLLAETFINDMDGQLRELGIGDIVVGKHIGRMMAALGGRLGAYRQGFGEGGNPRAALLRNLYRGEDPGAAALGHVETALRAFAVGLERQTLAGLLAGNLGEA
jgi:cytochrome b pre-mRNA-processing protein 3